jgi:hypothetical protein
MRRPNPDSRNSSSHLTGLTAWLPVLAAMAIMVVGCLSTFLVLQLDEFRPKLGDIVTYKPGSEDSDMWQMLISASVVRPDGAVAGTCKLDPNVMAEKGGSLIVEALDASAEAQYRIHWQGSQTTATKDGCGTSAELTVSRTDLQRLANAAGGFGIGDKGMHD